MFNLEQAIVEWRRQMHAAGIKTPVPLDELENHLREEIERQVKLGINEAEAFNLAAQNIGTAPLVQDEFKKIEETKNARIWKRFEILILGWVSLISLFMASFFLQNSSVTLRMTGLAGVVSLLLLVWGGRWIQPKFLARARQIRNAIYVLSALFFALWCLLFLFEFILPNNYFSPEQYLVSLLWEMLLPIGAGMGFELGTKRCRFQNVIAVGT
jgi:hypothetical protein